MSFPLMTPAMLVASQALTVGHQSFLPSRCTSQTSTPRWSAIQRRRARCRAQGNTFTASATSPQARDG